MSLQGLPGTSEEFNIFVTSVRLFMRDYPELNRLVEGEESNDRLIAFSIDDAISDFNSTPPYVATYAFQDFMSRGWAHPLRMGTCICLLESVSILQMRNHLAFSDGVATSVSDKAPQLQGYSQLLDNRWQQWKIRTKVADNISNMFTTPSGVSSELFIVNGHWYDEYY